MGLKSKADFALHAHSATPALKLQIIPCIYTMVAMVLMQHTGHWIALICPLTGQHLTLKWFIICNSIILLWLQDGNVSTKHAVLFLMVMLFTIGYLSQLIPGLGLELVQFEVPRTMHVLLIFIESMLKLYSWLCCSCACMHYSCLFIYMSFRGCLKHVQSHQSGNDRRSTTAK